MLFQYASDRTLLVSFGGGIALETHQRVRRLLLALETEPVPEICNLHPAYSSLLVKFDPYETTHLALEEQLRERIARMDAIPLPPPNIVEIPVSYGGPDGPDLPGVAESHNLTPAQAIELHSSATYAVYFLGFVPGFAYLGGLPAELATPRLATPRKRVEAGSVAIGGNQAGVYPFPTPGGWRIIGRTPLQMFQAGREHMSLLTLGDQVRFRPL